MNYCHRFGRAALCAAPLLVSCVVRWDPSPENDEFGGPSERGSGVSEGAGRWSEPASNDSAPRATRPPLIGESESPADRGEGRAPAAVNALGGRYRDLIVIDPDVVAGRFASSDAEDAPFSFRAQMQWLAGASSESLEFTRSWLLAWENTSEVGTERAPVRPRPELGRVLVDPWLAASGAASSERSPRDTARYGDATGDAPGDATGDAPSDAAGDDAYAGSQEPAAPASGYPSPAPTDPGYGAAPEPASSPSESTPAYPSPASSPALPSWEHSPFHLIAIVNRVDLASSPCEGSAGELRYVYAAVDPESSKPLDLTLILEVPYPTTRSAAEWARAWRDLAALPPGSAYTAGLVALTREVQAQADPLRVRLRTDEVALSDPDARTWEMREFDVQIRSGALELAQVPLEFTPRADADPAELSDYVLEHADEIEGAGASLPESLRAGAAEIGTPDFSWSVLGVSERLRRAFSVQTCNGCHGGDTAALPFRHIEPGASLDVPARLSRYLYDPDAATDELRRRSGVLDDLVDAECAPDAASDDYLGG